MSNQERASDLPLVTPDNPIEQVRRRVSPEVQAGGFADNDGSLLFYSRVQSLATPESVVLDYGAGRGVAPSTDPCLYRRGLRVLRGKVKHVVGCDVDQAVHENPHLDEAHVIDPHGALPFADDTFDLIVSDYVIEHVDDPKRVASELERVLKPGGWLLARTPNLFGYAAIGTLLTPPFLRKWLLRRLNPNGGGRDNFPVRLKMNTLGAMRRHFPSAKFDNHSFIRRFEGMGYFGRSALAVRLARFCMHFLPSSMGPELVVVLRKHGDVAASHAKPAAPAEARDLCLDDLPSLLPSEGAGSKKKAAASAELERPA